MSANFHAAVQALANDPVLREQVVSATSAEQRASILRDAGIELPTQADVDQGMAELAGVAGGSGSTTGVYTNATAAQSAMAECASSSA